MDDQTRCVYLGNFGPPHSTETHVALSLEALGVEVLRAQEGSVHPREIPYLCRSFNADLFLWTQTYGLAQSISTNDERAEMCGVLRDIGIPSVGFHLDRWWGLKREAMIHDGDTFLTRLDWLFTADGGHDKEWEQVTRRHVWSPPAVYHAEAYDGTPREEFVCDVAFVGSWSSYAHEEWWPHRRRMLDDLRMRYGPGFRCFPEPGQSAVRGAALNDLYASVKVCVGDSCLAPAKDGSPITRYWSDRIPETTGRGALLVHPYVEGITEVHPQLLTYPLGDFGHMMVVIDTMIDHDREKFRLAQAEETRYYHTYAMRMQAMLATVLGVRPQPKGGEDLLRQQTGRARGRAPMTVPMIETLINKRWTLLLPKHRAERAEWWDGWEKERLDAMHETIKPGDVVYDIGAEEGDLSALFAKWAGPAPLPDYDEDNPQELTAGGGVVLFEPNPRVWPNIKAIFESNGLEPLGYFVGFAADEPRTLDTFGAAEDHAGWPACAYGEVIGDHGFAVLTQRPDIPATTIDACAAGLTARAVPDVITIDVEGAELRTLMGARRTLLTVRPVVFVSIHPEFMRATFGDWADDLHAYMRELGYKGEHIHTDHEEHWVFRPNEGG